jgi:hypothetical protein
MRAVSGIVEAVGGISGTDLDPKKSVDSMQKVADMMSKVGEPGGVLETLTNSVGGDALQRVDESAKQIRAFSDSISKITDAIGKDAMGSALKAADEMVTSANELDDALASGIRIDTPARLKAFADKAGLGSTGNYTITNKGVQINVHLQVTMDVGEVEKVMIMRKESIIRDTVNFALDNLSPPVQPKSPIKETRTDYQIGQLTTGAAKPT